MIELRPYQQRAVDAVHAAWAGGARAVALVCPTGGGKTAMAHALADGQRALFLAHRAELVGQARAHRGFHPETIQGLAASGRRPPADLIIVDECHTVGMTKRWRLVLDDYPDARIVGLTATPERRDGSPLASIYQEMVVAASYSELLSGGYLVPARLMRPDRDLEGGIAQPALDTWQRLAVDRPGIAFCGSVDLARALADGLNAAGIPAACVDSRMHWQLRSAAVERFRAGELQVLTNCYCLVEGFDAPRAEVCLLARGCTHIGAYVQMVGRVLRPAPGKDSALVIDLSGASHSHGLPGADLEYSLEGTPMRPACDLRVIVCPRCGRASQSRRCPDCGYEPEQQGRAAPHLYSCELREVYAGAETPAAAQAREWERLMRLCRVRGYSMIWARGQYHTLFGREPDLRAEDRAWVDAEQRRRGYRRGWSYYQLLGPIKREK